MTGDRPPVRVSGSVELDLDKAAQRLATLIVDELQARGIVPAGDDRTGPYVPDMPRKVTPGFGEVTD